MSRWASARAGLITAVLVAQGLEALPLPELRPHHLENAIAREEIRRWRDLLAGAGLSLTEEELTAWGLAVGGVASRGRKAVLGPLEPAGRLLGIGQSWGLFAYPDPYAGRLVVEVRRGGADAAWEERFRAPQRGRDRLTRQLRYRRIRGVYDDAGDLPTPRRLYGRFVDWVAREIMLAEPDVQAVRVHIDLMEIRLPREGEEPPEKLRHVRLRLREKVLSAPAPAPTSAGAEAAAE